MARIISISQKDANHEDPYGPYSGSAFFPKGSLTLEVLNSRPDIAWESTDSEKCEKWFQRLSHIREFVSSTPANPPFKAGDLVEVTIEEVTDPVGHGVVDPGMIKPVTHTRVGAVKKSIKPDNYSHLILSHDTCSGAEVLDKERIYSDGTLLLVHVTSPDLPLSYYHYIIGHLSPARLNALVTELDRADFVHSNKTKLSTFHNLSYYKKDCCLTAAHIDSTLPPLNQVFAKLAEIRGQLINSARWVLLRNEPDFEIRGNENYGTVKLSDFKRLKAFPQNLGLRLNRMTEKPGREYCAPISHNSYVKNKKFWDSLTYQSKPSDLRERYKKCVAWREGSCIYVNVWLSTGNALPPVELP